MTNGDSRLIDLTGASLFDRFSASLLAELGSGPKARILALSLSDSLPESAILVYLTSEKASAWTLKAAAGDITADRGAIPLDSGGLGAVARERSTLQFR